MWVMAGIYLIMREAIAQSVRLDFEICDSLLVLFTFESSRSSVSVSVELQPQQV